MFMNNLFRNQETSKEVYESIIQPDSADNSRNIQSSEVTGGMLSGGINVA